MKAEHLDSLKAIMDDFLGKCDEDGGNPEWCYEQLGTDMAIAAACVYDSCMNGQKFAKENK
jgi:hypothetical protein